MSQGMGGRQYGQQQSPWQRGNSYGMPKPMQARAPSVNYGSGGYAGGNGGDPNRNFSVPGYPGGGDFTRAPMTVDMFDPNTGGMRQPDYAKPPGDFQSGTQQNPGGGYMPAGQGDPGAIGGPKPAQQAISDPYRDYQRGTQQGPGGYMPAAQQGGWQPSFGGSAPKPFMPGQPASQPPPQAPPPSFMPTPNNVQDPLAAWREQVSGGDRARQYGQNMPGEKAATTGSIGQPTQQTPPRPTGPLQPGQVGWEWGPDLFGNRDTGFDWRPQFTPDYKNYLVNQLRGGQVPWGNQIDRNNIIGSIGQLSGNQFTPNGPAFNTLTWGRGY